MLTPSYLDKIADEIQELYLDFEAEVIADIAKRIAKTGKVTATAAWQAEKAKEVGALQFDITKEIAKQTKLVEAEVARIFKEAGNTALAFDDEAYELAGLKPTPLSGSPQMLKVLEAGIVKNKGVLKNITRTTAKSAGNLLQKYSDLAHLEVTSGVFSYKDAISHAVDSLIKEGVTYVDFESGRKINVANSVRTNVLTGVNQTVAQLQIIRLEETGQDLVETTAHSGARPSHAEWQGKVFSYSGKSKKYPSFVDVTGYGQVDGLAGANCKHNFSVFVEGVSELTYSQKELQKMNNATVTYTNHLGESVTVSQYDGEQKLRSMERSTKGWKRRAGVKEVAGIDNSYEKSKVREWQAKTRVYVNETGLDRDYFREKTFI